MFMNNGGMSIVGRVILGATLLVSAACGPELPTETDSASGGNEGSDSESTTGADDPTAGEEPIERQECGPTVAEGWVTRCWNDNSFLLIGKSSDKEDAETIEEVHEPYLVQEGYIERTPRGRVITERTARHLGVPFESRSGPEVQRPLFGEPIESP